MAGLSKSTSLTDAQLKAQKVHGYSTQLVMDVQYLIDLCNKGEMAPNTAYEDIWCPLLKEKIVYEKDLNVDDVLCHTSNRGELGLNAYNCHRNGHPMDQAGVDMKELQKAAAFEMSPLQPSGSFQKAFNDKIVNDAKGLLAPRNGGEHHLSVGTGHWTAWIRAIKHGCRTPFKDMANSDGKLSADRFRQKDHRMKTCIDIGWVWRIFPWQCEVAWPQLPDLCQRALNSSHGVSSRSTELEVMSWVAESSGDSTSKSDYQELLKAVAMSGPSCAGYIDQVGHLATEIAGGSTSPILFFLDRFSKMYGENKTLGEEFVKSLAAMQVSKTDKLNYVKAACVACNLVADKVVDGIAKLLVRADIDRLKTSVKKALTIKIENALAQAWTIADGLVANGTMSQEQVDDVVGKLFVRSILFVCG